ncbi:MAG: TIGR02281 family clan AA aspartic protease [Pseudomonadota bacterium]
MLPDLATNPSFWFAIGGGVAFLLVASRVRALRVLLNIAITTALVGAVILAVAQREKFDPYFARMTDTLNLSGQEVVGREVRVRMSPDGHFWVRAKIDGVERRLLVDSGATVTALSTEIAAAAGLKPRTEPFPIILRTANGVVRPQTAEIAELRFGTIVARDLPVVVSPAFGDMSVLGMNFLSRLKSWRVEDGYLILTPHHPQDLEV